MSNARELSQLAPLVTVDANNKITFVSTSEVEFGGLAFPTTDGANGEVLTTDGAGNLTFTSVAAAGGGLSNIVEDTTPQLGGNLDVNDKLIYNDTGTVKLQAGSADYVTIVNSAGADRIRFSDIGGIAALGWYHQFGDSSSTRGLVNIMGTDQGFDPGSGALKIFDGDSSAGVTLTVPTTLSGNVLLTLPGADGSNGQVLTTDGSGNLSFTTISGGISNVVEDTTPQLGGNLDVNDKLIYNDTGTVKLQAGSADYVTIVNSSDVDKIRFSDIGGISALGWYHQFGDSTSARGVVNLMGSNTGISGTGALRIHDGASVNYVELTVPTSVPGSGYTLTLPSAVGANSQVLATTNTGTLFWANNLGSLSGDATPQLGGDLDNNGNNIQITNGNLLMQSGANSGVIYGASVYLGNALGTAGLLRITGDGSGTDGSLTVFGDVTLNDIVYPSSDGTNGQVLTTDGSGNLSFADASGGIADIVEDTTPQLGGNLDTVGNKITSSSSYLSLSGSTGSTGGQNTQTGQVYIQGADSQSSQSGNVYITGVGGGSLDSADVGNVYINYQGNNTQPYGTTYIGSTNGLNGGFYDNEVQIRGLWWPDADGSNGQVLTTDGAGNLSFADASGGISNLVEDTTPQLGGNLDLNGKYIGHANANMKAYDFSTGSSFEVAMQGSTAFSIYANMGSSVANVTINDDLIVQGGDITLGGTGRIQGIDTVSANTDAANKLYVDNAVAGVGGGISNVVEDTTPQLGGNLDLNNNYIGDSTAYMKAYDFGTGSQFAVYMQGELSPALEIYSNAGSSTANVSIKSDLTVSGGDITLGGTGRIQGIDTVSANTDAANKLYVDNAVAGAGGGGFAQSYTNNEVFN